MTRPTRLATLLALLVFVPACTRPTAVKSPDDAAKQSENPWPKAAAALRKETDLVAARRVLSQLSGDLSLSQDPAVQAEGLDPESARAVQQALDLSESEVKELLPPTYTDLDANHLAECLYLRDAARSLEPEGQPPARQAELAFAWVCRQVVLHPWEMLVQESGGGATIQQAVVPVTYVLQRGSGSGLERAYVFLGLTAQLGLDGCLIGTPASAKQPSAAPYPQSADPKPRGPFWAVGVRVGPDVLLFDPWRGEPLPGPDGKGVATLAQVKANPDQLKAWFEDRSWPVTADQVKSATPYLALPLSAAAPRMRRLEKELTGDSAVRLALDPVALKARFAAEAKLPDVACWNPPGDPATYTRVLASFLPADAGGTAPGPEMMNAYRRTMLPANLFSVHPALLGKAEGDIGLPEAVEQIRLRAVGEFFGVFLAPPTPRELIQRGQFAEVTPILVNRRQHFTAAQERIRTDRNREQAINDWVSRGSELFTRLSRARSKAKEDPAALAEAQRAVENFWREEDQTARALVDLAVAEAGHAEATFLLAQCMHEQAERDQARFERAAADPRQVAAIERARQRAAAAWAEARDWWRRYEPYAAGQEQAYPGRSRHAHALAERAARLAAAGR